MAPTAAADLRFLNLIETFARPLKVQAASTIPGQQHIPVYFFIAPPKTARQQAPELIDLGGLFIVA